MNYDDFKNKYYGRGIDFDHFYGFQCMDLAEQYNQEVIGAPKLGGNAKDVWTNFPQSFYTKVANTPSGVPQKGDIVIWGEMPGNSYGHIAVFDNGNVNAFTSFDQNWPGGSVCHLQPHNYTYVLGWLHPKTIQQPNASQKISIVRDILSSSITDDERVTQIKVVIS